MNPFKAVFFDLDETLRLRTPGPTDAFILFVRASGHDIQESRIFELKRWVHAYWADDERVNQDIARLGKDAFKLYYSEQLVRTAGISENVSHWAERVNHWFYHEYSPTVRRAPGSRKMLRSLKQAGYSLGLISNRREPLDSAVAELDLTGLFDLTLAAGEVGHWKPDPAIFQAALARFEALRPEECLYVGDNYHADGFGAARVGMTPVIFDPDNLYECGEYRRISKFEELEMVLL